MSTQDVENDSVPFAKIASLGAIDEKHLRMGLRCRQPDGLEHRGFVVEPPRASHDAAADMECDDRAVRPTVLIVDDHADFRRSARALLEAEGFDVVGEAATGESALRAVGALRPQIVLLDVRLPDLDGLAVAEQIVASPVATAVVLISSRDAAAYGARLSETSACGFIPKRRLSGAALAALVGR